MVKSQLSALQMTNWNVILPQDSSIKNEIINNLFIEGSDTLLSIRINLHQVPFYYYFRMTNQPYSLLLLMLGTAVHMCG